MKFEIFTDVTKRARFHQPTVGESARDELFEIQLKEAIAVVSSAAYSVPTKDEAKDIFNTELQVRIDEHISAEMKLGEAIDTMGGITAAAADAQANLLVAWSAENNNISIGNLITRAQINSANKIGVLFLAVRDTNKALPLNCRMDHGLPDDVRDFVQIHGTS